MILVNRTLLIILSLLIIILTLAAGWFGYVKITGSAGLSVDEIRFQAEHFLFYSFITGVVLITGFSALLLRSRYVDRKLDRLIEMSKYSDIYPEKHFVGLGPLGERLKQLYRQINNLNLRKTMKISALANLNEFLMNNISLPLLVTDVTGRILYSTAAFIEKLGSTRGDLAQKKIEHFISDLNVPTLMVELSRQHIPLEREGNRLKLTCYPIHNVWGELNYVVFSADKKAAYSELQKSGIEVIRKANTIAGRLSRMLSKRKA